MLTMTQKIKLINKQHTLLKKKKDEERGLSPNSSTKIWQRIDIDGIQPLVPYQTTSLHRSSNSKKHKNKINYKTSFIEISY